MAREANRPRCRGADVMGRVAASIAELSVHRVDVVEAGEPARRHWTKCEIGKNLKFDTAGLEAYCFANWDARVFDAFVLAAAVEFCDRTKARRLARWGRDIFLRVPIHDPAHWHSTTVLGALRGGLEFLTGDRWHLEFVARRKAVPPPRQRHLCMPDCARSLSGIGSLEARINNLRAIPGL